MPWAVETVDSGVRVVLSGHVDIFEAAPLHRLLLELAGEPGRVQMDLAGCVAIGRIRPAALARLPGGAGDAGPLGLVRGQPGSCGAGRIRGGGRLGVRPGARTSPEDPRCA
jgi:hypothetical protein